MAEQYEGPERRSVSVEAMGVKAKMEGMGVQALIAILGMAILIYVAVETREHKAETQSIRMTMLANQAEMTQAVKDLAASQKFLACVLSQPETTNKALACAK